MPFSGYVIPYSETNTGCQAEYSHLALMEVAMDIECRLARLFE